MPNLLKDVMIDAKVVKETALANARAALEEAFSPKLEAMFSQRLKEIEDDESSMDLTSDIPVDDEFQAPAETPAPQQVVGSEQDLDLGMEEPEDMQQISESEDVSLDSAPAGEKTDDCVGVNGQTKHAQTKDDTCITPALSGDVHPEPKSPLPGAKTHDAVGVNGQTKQAQSKDDTSITTSLNEELASILEELDSESDEITLDDEEMHSHNEGMHSDDEEINLDEVIAALKEGEEDCDEDEVRDEEKEALIKENNEYKRAIVFLKGRINEVNLLNAKLLYTNKLFKSANISDNQKVKIIEGLDRAKTVREVKYAYSLLAESLNFGAKRQSIQESSSPVKKSTPPAKRIVNTITEGLASKPVSSTRPAQKTLLTEGDLMAARFQKLAGIKPSKS
jgi:hypothetical protein